MPAGFRSVCDMQSGCNGEFTAAWSLTLDADDVLTVRLQVLRNTLPVDYPVALEVSSIQDADDGVVKFPQPMSEPVPVVGSLFAVVLNDFGFPDASTLFRAITDENGVLEFTTSDFDEWGGGAQALLPGGCISVSPPVFSQNTDEYLESQFLFVYSMETGEGEEEEPQP